MEEQLILIIDDSESEGLITKRSIFKINASIRSEVAFSGEQGLAFLRNGKPFTTLILLDLKMPGMGGIDFLRRIRADDRLSKLPVIVVTNSSLEADERESLEAGANCFVRKAFNMDQFQRDLATALKKWIKN